MNKELALKEYGLTDKEIKVYLELLPLGSINLQEIAKRIDLPRTTIYNTLNYLHQKGLVSKIIKKRVTYFDATEPEKLIEDINQKKDLLLKSLPELKSLKSILKKNSKAEIYEGTKGISKILTDVFNVKQEVCYFGSYTLSVDILKHIPDHVRSIRLERKIPAKIIIEPYDEPTFKTKQYKKITKMKFLPSMKDFPCMIFVYGDKVAIYTLKNDLVGIIIENQEVARSMKLVFEMYWKMAK